MPILVYNTLTGKKEEFIPQEDKKIKMYVCGITPYDTCHLGHARCYVVFDVIRRYLEYRGYQVDYIQNFTDIDDKIIKRSQELGVKPADLAEKYVQEFLLYSEKLNLKPPKAYPRVTQMMSQIIKMIEGLVKKGYAYESDGNVFYSVRKFAEYGKLSKRNLVGDPDKAVKSMTEEFRRIEPDERKNDPLDFALWKASKEGEPFWVSPWGKGRPGWHIECSTMSMEYLGETLDIHGGGQDLIFPHHENEIAQSEAYTGKQFVRYWLHNGFVTINKEKMSKSLGNFFTLEEIFQKFDPLVVRYYLISQHYRSPLDFSNAQLEQARSAWESLIDTYDFAHFIFSKKGLKYPITPAFAEASVGRQLLNHSITKRFELAMDDDFNTAEGLAQIFSLREEIIQRIKTQDIGSLPGLISLYRYLIEDVLGLKLPEPLTAQKIDDSILNLLDQREKARKNNDFTLADNLRKEIENKDYLIEDTPFGPRLKKKS
ncbi:MAG TPA: cysteine--tRNA ligase [Elusimicrobia bacterium]|jgi:cysteinyl-tRNA synthetase|nr:cysteine--tRNA ligase [Elusimicrobiota bacterium]